MQTFEIRIESGVICEAFTVEASSERAAVAVAWDRFEAMVSPKRFENAEITGINAR